MAQRCKVCGFNMLEAIIDGATVWQCHVCGHVEAKEAQQDEEESRRA